MMRLILIHLSSCPAVRVMIAALVFALSLCLHPASAEDRQSVIVVVGAEGAPEFGPRFQTWAERWKDAAQRASADFTIIGLDQTATAGEPDDSKPAVNAAQQAAGAEPLSKPESETLRSDRDLLQAAISEYGSKTGEEPLWLVLIGHGTFDNKTASFSLRGPDVSATVLAEWCAAVPRPMNIINCSSCSAPFLNALSRDGNVVVTATKDGNQVQYSRFGDYFSQAVSGLDADIDRDGQTSLLEAWLFAARRTAEFYESEGRLATEHSLLDDTGDQRGTRAELFTGFRPKEDVKSSAPLDGQLASRRHLVRSEDERRLTTEQRRIRDDLELQLEELRRRKDELAEPDYLNHLEEILLPLARLYESLDETPPPTDQ